MKKLIKKWWFWLILVLVIVLIIFLFPIWCGSYYLPDPVTREVIEKTYCGPISDLFKTF